VYLQLQNQSPESPKVHEHCDYILQQTKLDGDWQQNGRPSFRPLEHGTTQIGHV